MKNIFRKILIKFLRAVLPIEISELQKKDDLEIREFLNETLFYIYMALACLSFSVICWRISSALSATNQPFFKYGLIGVTMISAVVAIIFIIVYNNNYQKIKRRKQLQKKRAVPCKRNRFFVFKLSSHHFQINNYQ